MLRGVDRSQKRPTGFRTILAAAALAWLSDSDNRRRLGAIAKVAGEVTGLGPRLEALLTSSGLETKAAETKRIAGEKAQHAVGVGLSALVEGGIRAIDATTEMRSRNTLYAVNTTANAVIKALTANDTAGAKRGLSRLSKNVGDLLRPEDEEGFQRFIAAATAKVDNDPKAAIDFLQKGPGGDLFKGTKKGSDELGELLHALAARNA